MRAFGEIVRVTSLSVSMPPHRSGWKRPAGRADAASLPHGPPHEQPPGQQEAKVDPQRCARMMHRPEGAGGQHKFCRFADSAAAASALQAAEIDIVSPDNADGSPGPIERAVLRPACGQRALFTLPRAGGRS